LSSQGNIFGTATGRMNVIRGEHMAMMKDKEGKESHA
jgi:S-adenosylhomocysteine hydrolase